MRRILSVLPFLVLRAQVGVVALPAVGGTEGVPRIAAHADLHIQEACLRFGKPCHDSSSLSRPLYNAAGGHKDYAPDLKGHYG